MNRKYPIQVTSSTTFLPVLPDGGQYFIVGAINTKNSEPTIQPIRKNTLSPNTIMACPPGAPLTVPGLGIPVSQFKLDSAAEVQVYYYTT